MVNEYNSEAGFDTLIRANRPRVPVAPASELQAIHERRRPAASLGGWGLGLGLAAAMALVAVLPRQADTAAGQASATAEVESILAEAADTMENPQFEDPSIWDIYASL